MWVDVIVVQTVNNTHRAQGTICVYVFMLNKTLCCPQPASEYQWMDHFYIQLGGLASVVQKKCFRQEFAVFDMERIGSPRKIFVQNMSDSRVIFLTE
tara:strand:+ start:1113 stop:1403 length:291 start_codon:yes stop_codon:yes gene_type:complete